MDSNINITESTTCHTVSKEEFFRILNDSGFCFINFAGNDTESRILEADIRDDRIVIGECNSLNIHRLYNPHDIWYWDVDEQFYFSARLNNSLYAGEIFCIKLFKLIVNKY